MAMRRWPVVRRDLIGRRFFALECSGGQGDETAVEIRKGVIRASTHAECSAVETKVLVEYDDALHWKARKWVAIYRDFDVFLIENDLVGVVDDSPSQGQYQLAHEFVTLVDKRNHSNHLRHVEYLMPNRPVQYVPNSRILRFKEDDYAQLSSGQTNEFCRATLSSWMQFQQSQQIMINYPSLAVGHVVSVYNIESNSQWYIGRITGFNENTKSVTVVDENGLERKAHCALVQMELSSTESTSILREIAGAKPRGRLSLEEHPMIKQPRLDVSAGKSSNDAAPNTYMNLQRMRPLVAGNASQGSQILALDPGSRNIFQAVLKADAELRAAQAKPASHKQPVSSSVPLPVEQQRSTIQATKLEQQPADWVRVSSARNLEPSKIKSLLGYRPRPVMIVLPTPCIAASSAAMSSATVDIQGASHVGLVSSVCSDQILMREVIESVKRGNQQVTVNSRLPHCNAGQLSRVQFAGGIMLQQDQRAVNPLTSLKIACGNPTTTIKGVQNMNDNGAMLGNRQTVMMSRSENLNQTNTLSAAGDSVSQLFHEKNKVSESFEVVSPERTCGQRIFGVCPPLRGPLEVKLLQGTRDSRFSISATDHQRILTEGKSMQAVCLQEVSQNSRLQQLTMLNGSNAACNQQTLAARSPRLQQIDCQRVSEGLRSGEMQRPSGVRQLRMPNAQNTDGLLGSRPLQGQNDAQKQTPIDYHRIRLPINRSLSIGQQLPASLQVQRLQTRFSPQTEPGTSKMMGSVAMHPVTATGIERQQRPDCLQGISSSGGFGWGGQGLRGMNQSPRTVTAQVPTDLARLALAPICNPVGPVQVRITAVSAQPKLLDRKDQDLQNQSRSVSVVPGSCLEFQGTTVMQHSQSSAVDEVQHQVPLVVSVESFALGNARLTNSGEQRPQYAVAGGHRAKLLPTASTQLNANRMTLGSPKNSRVNCIQPPSCRLSQPPTIDTLNKSSRELVQEVVENVLRKFDLSADFAPYQSQQKHTRVNSVINPMEDKQPHHENQPSLNRNGNACQGILNPNNKNSLVSGVCTAPSTINANHSAQVVPSTIAAASIQTECVGTIREMNSVSTVNCCKNMEYSGGESTCNKFFGPSLRTIDTMDSCNSSAVADTLSTASSGSLVQQTGKDCVLQKQVRRSNSRSYEVKLVRNPKVVSKPCFEASVSAPCRQMPMQTVSECLDQLSSGLKHPPNVNFKRANKRILKVDVSSTDSEYKRTPGQFDRSADHEIGVPSKAKVVTPLSQVTLTGKGKDKGWLEEYESELMDLSRVLEMMKRLDNGPCAKVGDFSTSQMTVTNRQKSPFSTRTSTVSTADRPCPSTHHPGSIVVRRKKSDCEIKMNLLHQELLTQGLKFENPSVALSKKKLNSFNMSSVGLRTYIQDRSCLELASVLQKCRECKSAYNSPSKHSQVLCRFHAFRRLVRNAKGGIVSGGFSNPTDADAVDISLWMPLLPMAEPQIDIHIAKYIVKNVGNRFCELVEQEKEAMSWVSSCSEIAWKRAVNGIREMCDVCSTTLFNIHWVCRKCGYVACLDCFRTMTRRCAKCHGKVACKSCDLGHLKWAKCSVDRHPHEPKEMMLTQIIPSDVLWVVGRIIHDIRKKWNILENCPCGEDKSLNLLENIQSLEQVNHVTQSDENVSSTDSRGLSSGLKPPNNDSVGESSGNSGDVGAVGLSSLIQPVESSCDKNVNYKNVMIQSHPTLRDFLLGKNSEFESVKGGKLPTTNCKSFNNVFQRVVNDKLFNLVPKVTNLQSSFDSQTAAGNGITPDPGNLDLLSDEHVPHAWLDNGRLLQLLEPHHPGNLRKFQEVWQKGKPVLISNCDQHITKELWLPETFAKEFGDMENDLVDCTHKVVLIGHKMRHFWQGFEKVSARLKDSHGEPMILKLKDWPPMEDFSEMLPSRFKDLLRGLPLPEYTHRTGVFNLASRLPEYFVRPDLGPKMYNAYGSALHPMVGSTNLHLDVSDAVNLILYVGIPKDDTKDHEAAAIEGMKTAGCCQLTMARITDEGYKPGALWHIFDAKDSDKIRDLLTKVGLEIGEPVEPNHDPIHDQSWYLDEVLRERLLREYSVQGYTLVQCIGDAIFIPAGAPHQVRNFHSCIKAAEDFVSPENLSHCFQLTQEFRHLSDTHSNHEDKLQVKNIIYHAVKDAIAVLQDNEFDSA